MARVLIGGMCAMMAAATLGAAGGLIAFQTEQVLAEDKYETAEVRKGSPEIIRENISSGLLVETGIGIYRTASRVELGLSRDAFPMPEGTARLVQGVRLYGFGTKDVPAHLLLTLDAGTNTLAVEVAECGGGKPFSCRLTGKGFAAKTCTVSRASLPIDIAVYAGDTGDVDVRFTSLSDASIVGLSAKTTMFVGFWKDGFGYPPVTVRAELVNDTPGAMAEVRVDDHYVGRASRKDKVSVPCVLNVAKTFDPVKAGWPLVFADEFDGPDVDWSKWYYTVKAGNCKRPQHVRTDGKGVLEMDMNYGPDGKHLEAVSLRSKQMFVYGYYEARLKVTKQNGWWAAFWMYGRVNTDPFVDGFEIDIFEDYYTRRLMPDGRNRFQLDHNLHMYLGNQLKSWNYSSDIEGDLDDWITIGCKRTPFEISYYLNGKLISSSAHHSNWSSVTFDAFNHALGSAPLTLILSQQVMNESWRWFDKSKATFPEVYRVDYVRAYAMPETDLPQIAWQGTAAQDDGSIRYFKPGETLHLEVAAKPNARTASPIKAVYLFDAGYLLEYRTKPPYVFDVAFTPEYFKATAYMKPGRQNVIPDFKRAPHSFAAYVQDESGKIAETKVILRRHPEFFSSASTPYAGKAQAVPGALKLWQYDEGGDGVAYFDTSKGNSFATKPSSRRPEGAVDCTETELAQAVSGEWVNYTVDVKEGGDYKVHFKYGTTVYGHHSVTVFVDGERRGIAEITHLEGEGSWATVVPASCAIGSLSPGRHIVTLLFYGNLNIGSLKITH